jgi:predicted neuraminidase
MYAEVAIIAGVVMVAVFWLLLQLRKRVHLDFSGVFGASYILKTRNTDKAFDMFMKLRERTAADGIIISRVFPDRLRKMYKLEDSILMWLSHQKTDESIDPSNLEKLEFIIHEFISRHEGALVLIDGIEYIILQDSFENALKFLQSLNDLIILNKATLIIPLNPVALNKKELSLLERELESYQVDYRLMRFFE